MKKESKELGIVIDEIYAFDQRIHALEQKLKKIKQTRAKRELKLLGVLQKSKLERAGGKLALANVTSRKIPSIKNPRKFQQYVKKHNAFDLYQNRMSSKAYFDRLEAGAKIPGVSIFNKVGVSIRKRG